MGDAGQDRALALAREALAAAPAGLVTDLDGTLAPIVADPAAARPAAGAVEALAALRSQLALVAVVTGRSAADARRMLGRDDLLVIGNHGLEWLAPQQAAPAPTARMAAAAEAVERAATAVPLGDGVSIERKGLSATIHLRRSGDPDAARARTLEALRAAGVAGITVRPGRMSLELRPAGAGDKGTALRTLLRRHRLRGLVVLGDDVTDLDMFRAASAARSGGGLRAAIIGVGGGREVPAEVAAATDAELPDVEAAAALLRALTEDGAAG